MRYPRLLAAAILVLVAVLHYATVPRTIWEFDESFFAMGVERYEPLVHHPPPPGYPVYMAFAKLVALFSGNAFQALLATSILGVAAGLLTWFLAFREITGDALTAVLGTALLYVSPAVLVSGTLPQSDSGALALLGLAAWACARGEPQFAAIACAACIGWRVQFSIAVVPLFVASIALMKTWRDRAIAVGAFATACLVWFVPLVIATEGPASFWRWLSGQASYYAQHDANLSRGGYSPSLIALRFLAHPWGPKWLSIPLLAVAAGGATLLVLKKNLKALPLVLSSVVYFAFALATMDPADAVRYAIPALPAIALLAAVPLLEVATIGVLLSVAYAAGAMEYAVPVVRARAVTDAPPAAAAKWIRAHLPKNTVIVYDLPLRPQAEYLLRGYTVMRIDAGLNKFGGDPDVPMAILANGERAGAPGVTFLWPDTDAYRKLTRQQYGAVSVIPLQPAVRYRVLEGISPEERTREGDSWRWLAGRAVLELPDLGGTHVKLVFRAPGDYPLGENRIRVSVHGRESFVTVQKGAAAEVLLPIPRGKVRVVIDPEKTFVPAEIPGSNNRDVRTLSVMLTKVEQAGVPPTAR